MYYCNNERLSKRKGAARDEWRCFFTLSVMGRHDKAVVIIISN